MRTEFGVWVSELKEMPLGLPCSCPLISFSLLGDFFTHFLSETLWDQRRIEELGWGKRDGFKPRLHFGLFVALDK